MVSRVQLDLSAQTYPAFRRAVGQDGEPRVPVLINGPASSAIFQPRVPRHRLTVRPSPYRHPQTSRAGAGFGSADPGSGRHWRHGRGLVDIAVSEQRPHGAGHLGRHGYHGRVEMRPREQPAEPDARRCVSRFQRRQRCPSALDQHLAEVLAPPLGDAEELRPAAGRRSSPVAARGRARPRGLVLGCRFRRSRPPVPINYRPGIPINVRPAIPI